MPKLNLIPKLWPPHWFMPIKNFHEAPIVHFAREENPNRISDSSQFTAKNKNNSGKVTAKKIINSKSKSNSNLSSSMSVQSNLY